MFIKQSYFSVPKKVRSNSIHYPMMKIYNKRQLQRNLYASHQYYLKMETIFMNTENSTTNKSGKHSYYFTDKVDLEIQIEILYWLI